MGARELLHEMVGAGFTIEVDGGSLKVRPASKLTDELRAELRAAKPELLALLTEPRPAPTPGATAADLIHPYKLTQAEADEAHREPWAEADITRFSTRVLLFLRRGINATDADDLAERLGLRDLQGDDRRLCLECAHLSGRHCGNARAAGVGRDLPPELVTLLQRCPGSQPVVPVT